MYGKTLELASFQGQVVRTCSVTHALKNEISGLALCRSTPARYISAVTYGVWEKGGRAWFSLGSSAPIAHRYPQFPGLSAVLLTESRRGSLCR